MRRIFSSKISSSARLVSTNSKPPLTLCPCGRGGEFEHECRSTVPSSHLSRIGLDLLAAFP